MCKRINNNLRQFVIAHPRLLVITGAGCSVASGIPTYRDETGEWRRSEPIQHQEFLTLESKRKRYWARSIIGWPAVYTAQTSVAHQSLAKLEQQGFCQLLVTQNVDRLHQRAGHKNVIDLHGRLDQVICLRCGQLTDRELMQTRLLGLNAQLAITAPAELAPDGDADVADELANQLKIPACEQCDGTLKPNVVFYGGTVDTTIVQSIYSALDNIDGLLVIGSSLMVFSSFRFCRRANEMNIPIAAINRGITRADEFLSLKLNEDCEQPLLELVRSLAS
jgi:NAD-dependent SIR2 family protein deacetylase